MRACTPRAAYAACTENFTPIRAGCLSVQVRRLEAGGGQAPTAPVDSARRVLSAPSTVCHNICKAADFFRFATTGSLLAGVLLRASSRAACYVNSQPRCRSLGR